MKYSILVSTAVVFLSSCSAPQRPVVEKVVSREVSVTAAGVEVPNYQNQLVHRLSVTKRDIDMFFNTATNRLQIPYQLRRERDLRGGTKGLRVVGATGGGAQFWGIHPNDLITAIGTKPAQHPDDFWGLRRELLQAQSASLTLVRGNSPHKIIYYLEGS